MELTVTEALVKLKLADSKINDATKNVVIGFITTEGNKTIPAGFQNFDEYRKELQARLDSATGLIKHRDKLKKAVVESNARTKVLVGKKEMTVAEAIEMKTSLKYRKALLVQMESQWNDAQRRVDQTNALLDNKADEYVQKVFAGSVATESDKQTTRRNWLEQNRMKIVTIDKMQKTIQSFKEEIQEFEANVDTALSVVNAKTLVSIAD